eukprot:2242050-Rhodomonas_salina.1
MVGAGKKAAAKVGEWMGRRRGAAELPMGKPSTSRACRLSTGCQCRDGQLEPEVVVILPSVGAGGAAPPLTWTQFQSGKLPQLTDWRRVGFNGGCDPWSA